MRYCRMSNTKSLLIKVALLLAVAALFVLILAAMAEAEDLPLRGLFTDIGQVESGGDDEAVGKAGEQGRYQILRPYWQDAIEHAPELGGRYEDVKEPRYAEFIMLAYWLRHCPGAVERMDTERLARTHHRGCNLWADAEGAAYWARVKVARAKTKRAALSRAAPRRLVPAPAKEPDHARP